MMDFQPQHLSDLSGDATRSTLPAQFLHDLLTPLNHIIGYSQMLTEQAREEGQSGFVPDLQRIHTAAQQLLDLLRSKEETRVFSQSPHLTDAQFAADSSSTLARMIANSSPSSQAPALILVADDNQANREVLSRRLQRQGYDVVMVENGRDALAAMQMQAFDLVLLDIMMPEMDGYQALQAIKTDPALGHIPVVMISALHEMESVVRCIELGAEDYLCKPFDPTLLKARVGSCLEKKQSRDRERQLFEQLQHNYARLQELEKLRDSLTHMIIHDLRTPLSAVMVGMQALEVVGDLNKTQRELMSIALGGGETLIGMINELLDVDKMESGSMQLDYTQLSAADLISAAAAQVASLVQTKNLQLRQHVATDLPTFRGDENKLLRTLVNLLGNAIKFTPSGGTIVIAAGKRHDHEPLVFSVSDTGEGIPRAAFARIFEKFGQVESSQNKGASSTGLGLTFCKLAVEAHGSHIDVESVLGKGSTFSFAIPQTEPEIVIAL